MSFAVKILILVREEGDVSLLDRTIYAISINDLCCRIAEENAISVPEVTGSVDDRWGCQNSYWGDIIPWPRSGAYQTRFDEGWSPEEAAKVVKMLEELGAAASRWERPESGLDTFKAEIAELLPRWTALRDEGRRILRNVLRKD